MRIKTRIQLSIVLSVVLAATVGLLLFLSIRAMNEASRKMEIAAEVVKAVVELKILTDDYLLHPGDRSLIQWRSRYNFATKRLTGGYFRSPDEKIPVDEILKDLERIKTVFTEITIYMRKKQQPGKQEGAISRALQDRLKSELLVKAQAAVSLVFPLQQKIQAELMTTQKRASLLTILLLLTLTAVIVAIALWINRSIARPIVKLEEDIQIIGSGNLDYKVGTTAKDEIGQLSRAFDKMTADLKKTTASIVELNKEIDERKQAEETLQKMSEDQALLLDNIDTHIWHLTDLENHGAVNRALADFLGVQKSDIAYKSMYDILSKEEAEVCIAGNREVFDTKRQTHTEEWVRNGKGEQRLLSITKTPKLNDNGNVEYVVCTAEDITERKQTEETLKMQARVLESMAEGVNVSDEDGIIFLTNQAFDAIFEYERGELIGKHVSILNAYSREENARMINNIIEELKTHGAWFGEISNVKKDGTRFTTYTRVSALEVSGKRYWVSVQEDITERKQAEEALSQSEERYRALFMNNPIETIVVDSEGKVTAYNKAREERTKKGLQDRLPKPGDIMYTKDYAGKHKINMREELMSCIKSGKTKYFPEMKYDQRFLDINIAPFTDGAIITSIDITERKQAENEVKESREELRNLSAYLQSAREQERTIIAREIHDELGQDLTALKMDLSWLEKRFPKDKKILFEKTKSMTELVDTTIQSVKRISAELRPGLLDDLGLTAAIEWMAEGFQKRTGIKCKLTVDPEDIVLDQDCSTGIFRIFQETLTNITRHAKATQVKAVLQEEAGFLSLTITDNGKGITKKQTSDSESFGLIGMRERAHYLNGELHVVGIRGTGTTVTVKIPLEERD